MSGLDVVVGRIMRDPSPEDLWALHPVLLASEAPGAAEARDLARMFYCYLSGVRHKLTAKQYSELAARLAASSIGVIALHELQQALYSDRRLMLDTLLTGGLSSALEAFSTFQHVKAWEIELATVHDEAVWCLYEALWQLSAELQPDLPAEMRQKLIDDLLRAVRDPGIAVAARIGVVIRLFQIVLLVRLVPLFDQVPAAEGDTPGASA